MVFLFERCALSPHPRSDLNYNIATDLGMAENCPEGRAEKQPVCWQFHPKAASWGMCKDWAT
jgi:hypothetical protein